MTHRSLFTALLISGAACGATPDRYPAAARALERAPTVEYDAEGDDTLGQPLTAEALVAAVLARNPSLERARQGWRAALAEVDQATSLEDPMLGLQAAPLSFANPDVRIGFAAELSQRLPWPGKRRLRGEIALAEAEAEGESLRQVRQRLALMAVGLYLDYALLERALEINAEHLELLTELNQIANAYLETGRAAQADALKIDVDVARRRRQRAGLEADRATIRAQLNALLHRRPGAALPAPAELTAPEPPARTADALAEAALKRRPELRSLVHRSRGAEAAIGLAEKSDYPDFRLSGTFTRMFAELEHQIMVGVAINLPVWRGRRAAEKREARARAAALDAARAASADEIRSEVASASARLEEALATVELYRDQLVPTARDRVSAMRIQLDAGGGDFLEVIRAEADLRAAELELATAIADANRRRAELEWASGAVPAAGDSP